MNRNTQNYKFGKTCLSKCRCHGDVKFLKHHPTLPICCQINFRKTQKFGSVWLNLKKVIKVQSQRGPQKPPPPGLKRVKLSPCSYVMSFKGWFSDDRSDRFYRIDRWKKLRRS